MPFTLVLEAGVWPLRPVMARAFWGHRQRDTRHGHFSRTRYPPAHETTACPRARLALALAPGRGRRRLRLHVQWPRPNRVDQYQLRARNVDGEGWRDPLHRKTRRRAAHLE